MIAVCMSCHFIIPEFSCCCCCCCGCVASWKIVASHLTSSADLNVEQQQTALALTRAALVYFNSVNHCKTIHYYYIWYTKQKDWKGIGRSKKAYIPNLNSFYQINKLREVSTARLCDGPLIWKFFFWVFWGVFPDPMWGPGTGMSYVYRCKALRGKFVICDLGPNRVNWIEFPRAAH